MAIDTQTEQAQEPSLDGIAVSFPTHTKGGTKLPELEQLRKWHTECARWRMTWLAEAERLEGLVHAYQWTREQEQELEAQGRKAIRSPHIAKVIWSMVGWRSQNKYEIKYLPRGGSDSGVAEARTAVAKFIFDQNSAEYCIGDACLSQYIGPMGWVKVSIDETDPTIEPNRIEDVPWRQMGWDFRGKKLDGSDWKYQTRERWMALDDAQQLYPEFADRLSQMVTTRKEGDDSVNEYGMSYTEQRAGDPVGPVSTWPADRYVYAAREEVRLVEIWYRIKEKGHYLQLPDGRNVVFDPQSQQHQYAAMSGGIVRPGTINCVYTATFCGDILLEHMASPYDHGQFPYIPVWGLIDQKGIPYGIARLIEDEQLVINWSTSKLLWVAGSRQAYVGPGADLEAVAENLAKPDGLVPRNTKDDVEIIPQGDMTAINESLLQNALNNMREIGGSTAEARGQESNAHSGRAILARQDAAMRQQGRFMDNEQRAMAQIGTQLASNMDKTYTAEKIVRITENNGNAAQVAVNVEDPFRREMLQQGGVKVYGPIAQGEYDCVVTSEPLSTTQREAMHDGLTQMLGGLDPETRFLLLDMWVDGSSFPNKEEMVQRIQQLQKQRMNPPQQPQEPPFKQSISIAFADMPLEAQNALLMGDGLLKQPLDPVQAIPLQEHVKHAQEIDKAAHAHHLQQTAPMANAEMAMKAQAQQHAQGQGDQDMQLRMQQAQQQSAMQQHQIQQEQQGGSDGGP